MLHGTGLSLPRNVNEITITLPQGPGVLMQIVSMTEIAHSAWSLQNTRELRIDREHMDEEAVRIAEEDEGPVTDYPRGMLKLELSDGSTSIQAIEYRSLPDLNLGKTPLGYKILVKNALLRRGIAFLEPSCVVMKGYWSDDLEQHRDHKFFRSLQLRMGKADPGSPVPHDPSDIPLPRSPLREIVDLPPVPNAHNHNDDEGQVRRRRIPAGNSPPRASSHNTLVGSPRGNRPIATNRRVSALVTPPQAQLDDEFDFNDFNDFNDFDEELPPQGSLDRGTSVGTSMTGTTAASANQIGSYQRNTLAPAGNSWNSDAESEFGGSMILDEDVLAQIDEVEQRVLNASQQSAPSGSQPVYTFQRRTSVEVDPDVEIDVDDDDDDGNDKENVVVATRHVRRRVEASSSRQSSDEFDDVIDISDSD
jgi:RecQ-mediated genome instability protein 1